MSAHPKFSFAEIGTGSAPERRKADRRTIGPADLEAAKAEGYEAGRRDATAQAAQLEAQSLNAIARMMQMMLGKLATEAQGLREDAVELSMTAARAMAGQLLDTHGQEAVEAFFADAVSHLRTTPRLVVNVAADLAATVGPKLEQIAGQAGFTGAIVVRADPQALPGDCRLEWVEGSIHHDRAATLEAIETAAAVWLESASQHGTQMDLFSGGGH